MSIQNVEKDHSRFREIVKGAVRKNLKRYVSQGEILGKEGGKTVKIPIPEIEIPRFKFKGDGESGVGQGEGEEGDTLGQGPPQPGSGEAGDQPGEHELEAEVTWMNSPRFSGTNSSCPRFNTKAPPRSRWKSIDCPECPRLARNPFDTSGGPFGRP